MHMQMSQIAFHTGKKCKKRITKSNPPQKKEEKKKRRQKKMSDAFIAHQSFRNLQI